MWLALAGVFEAVRDKELRGCMLRDVFFCNLLVLHIYDHGKTGNQRIARAFNSARLKEDILNFECNTRFGHQIACFICKRAL